MNIYFRSYWGQHKVTRPEDVIKFIYQSVFGAEHLIQCSASSVPCDNMDSLNKVHEYFTSEWNSAEPTKAPLYEDISDTYARVFLPAWKYYGYRPEDLWDIFLKTASISSGGEDLFQKETEEIFDFLRTVLSECEYEDYEKYLREYKEAGIHPIHHSEEFRYAEAPSYRVVRREFLLPILSRKRTTLCYIESDGKYLMLHRTKKKNDLNEGKWIGVGGKLEPGETPKECIIREVTEETGLKPAYFTERGFLRFILPKWGNEDTYLYTAEIPMPTTLPICTEGDLQWIPKDKISELNLWDGDRAFLSDLIHGENEINLILSYDNNDQLISTEKL